ncbi:MAG: STAS domain-containing protein [Anaerolineae bacterium]|nr:STAS domain-containing protein [Anaerolineae bacterium]
MAFHTTVEMINRVVAKITLEGEIDPHTAPQFKECIENAADQNARRVALLMQDVGYISSAGVRVLIFAQLKLGPQVDIYLIGVRACVREVLDMTGLQDSMIFLDEYDAARIEQF